PIVEGYATWLEAEEQRARELPDHLSPEGLDREVTSIFLDLLSAINVEDAPRRARMLTSYLIGTATRQTVSQHPFTAVQAEISLICSVGG
ncbi:hypothetical protein ACWDAZ_36105, partial [Streptomyces sp. NPDC001215]